MSSLKNFEEATSDATKGSTQPVPTLTRGRLQNTVLQLGENATSARTYDFGNHYGLGFDDIISAYQQTVGYLLHSPNCTTSSLVSYCFHGLRSFAQYLQFNREAIGRDLTQDDITEHLIDGYISHLKKLHPESEGTTAKNKYTFTKTILKTQQQLGWLQQFDFPRNPFPNSNQSKQGYGIFSEGELKCVASALRADAKDALNKTKPLNSYELTILLLAIALRTGMNTTPLLEMTTDAISDHPFKENRKLLTLFKRRGNATQIQSIRWSEEKPTVRDVLPDVGGIVNHIIATNSEARKAAESELVFVYTHGNKPTLLAGTTLTQNIKKWRDKHGLLSDDGTPLNTNISRFRKTFENKIYELSGHDPFITAKLSNSSVKVTDSHYLKAPEHAERDFRLLGEIRVKEILGTETSAESNTPVAKCALPANNEQTDSANFCTDFFSCVICKNMVVTGDDLYRLFSFYWLIVSERDNIGAKKWKKHFAHIVRIIDNEIAPKFDVDLVSETKQKAKEDPHPAWQHRSQPS